MTATAMTKDTIKETIRIYKAIEDAYSRMVNKEGPLGSLFDTYDDLVEEAITLTNGDGPAIYTDPLTMNLALKTEVDLPPEATYNEMLEIQHSKMPFFEK